MIVPPHADLHYRTRLFLRPAEESWPPEGGGGESPLPAFEEIEPGRAKKAGRLPPWETPRASGAAATPEGSAGDHPAEDVPGAPPAGPLTSKHAFLRPLKSHCPDFRLSLSRSASDADSLPGPRPRRSSLRKGAASGFRCAGRAAGRTPGGEPVSVPGVGENPFEREPGETAIGPRRSEAFQAGQLIGLYQRGDRFSVSGDDDRVSALGVPHALGELRTRCWPTTSPGVVVGEDRSGGSGPAGGDGAVGRCGLGLPGGRTRFSPGGRRPPGRSRPPSRRPAGPAAGR